MKRDEVPGWLTDIFEEPAGSISLDTRRDEIVGWDSLGILSLMASFDQDFDVNPDPSEIRALDSVQDVVDLMHRLELIAE